MVQTTHAREGLYCSAGRGEDRASCWRVLAQPEMCSILMVVADVFAHEALEMMLIEHDHMIQEVASAASNPTLRRTILPRTPERCANWLAPHCANRSDYVLAEFAISVKHQELLSGRIGPRFTHLLNDPKGSGITRHIEVQNFSPIMTDHEEAIQDLEGECWYGEEIHGRDGLTVVSKECQPAFAWAPRHSPQPS